jgi:hypothetical protein
MCVVCVGVSVGVCVTVCVCVCVSKKKHQANIRDAIPQTNIIGEFFAR